MCGCPISGRSLGNDLIEPIAHRGRGLDPEIFSIPSPAAAIISSASSTCCGRGWLLYFPRCMSGGARLESDAKVRETVADARESGGHRDKRVPR